MNQLVYGKIKRISGRTVDVIVEGSGTVLKDCALTSGISILDVKENLPCTVMMSRSKNTILAITKTKSTDTEINYFSETEITNIQNIVNATYNNTYQIINGTILSDPGVTGRRFFTHGTRLAVSLIDTDTEIYVTHNIFVSGELLYLEKINETFEYILLTSGPVGMINPAGGTYYQHTVTRGAWGTTPREFPVYSMVYGLNTNGYINTVAKESNTSPMLSVKKWTNLANLEYQEIFRAGNLYGILGDNTARYGVFVGNQTSYMLFDSTEELFNIVGTTIKVIDTAGNTTFAAYAQTEEPFEQGDIVFGNPILTNMRWSPSIGQLQIRSGETPLITFDPIDGSVINQNLSVTSNGIAVIQIGNINNLASIYFRDRDGVPILSAVEDIVNSSVEVTIGRPEPNFGWVKYSNGLLEVNGTIRANYLQLLGSVASTNLTDIVLQEEGHTERLHMTPKYLEGIDDLNKRTALIVWKASTLPIDPNVPGVTKTWIAGEAFFGDYQSRHLRIERGPTARIGLFSGEDPKAYLDYNGNLYIDGYINAIGGSIGGWSISNDVIYSDLFFLQSADPALILGDGITWIDGPGVWMGKHNAVYKFRIGDPANRNMTWDGNDLFINGTSATLNNQTVAKSSDLDMEIMKMSFLDNSWGQVAIYETFDNESKRETPDQSVYDARVYYGKLDNGGDATANRSFGFRSKTYNNVLQIFSSTSTSVGAGYLEDTNGPWFDNQYRNYHLYDSMATQFNILYCTKTPRRLYVTGTPAAGTYNVWAVWPTKFSTMATWKDSTNGGYGYVKFEVSWNSGTNWQTIVDTEAGIDNTNAELLVTNPGGNYKFRVTLKNNASGQGAEFYKVLVFSNPSTWL